MHRDFASYFVDPRTRAPLTLEIARERDGNVIEGAFVSTSTQARYPIVNGIPRFVDPGMPAYADSFGYQWTRWPRVQFESENVGRPMEGHTTRMWERITNATDRQVAGRAAQVSLPRSPAPERPPLETRTHGEKPASRGAG